MMKKTNILWFRKDLRIHDNPTLLHAIKHSEKLVCVFIYDEIINYRQHGVDSLGPYRAQFLWETLASLKQTLQALGNDLITLQGDAVKTLKSLYDEIDADTIYAQVEYGHCEREQDLAISKLCKLEHVTSATLLDCSALPFDRDKIPNNYILFRRLIEQQWEKEKSIIPDICETPDQLPPLPDNLITKSLIHNPALESKAQSEQAFIKFKGGEEHALARVKTFIWDDMGLESYRNTCNQLLGKNYSCKLSPWIANGSLSVRYLYHEIRRFEQQHSENESTRWAICQLLWRDFFHYNALKHGANLFLKGGIQSSSNCKEILDLTTCEVTRRWRHGETGNRFIDANMKELLETGYLSNRGRQCVSIYLVKELGIDWRLGASWFEHLLLDFEPCNNYGNWNFQSGIGHDVKKLANFDIEQQAKRYDPEQIYQNYWLDAPSKS